MVYKIKRPIAPYYIPLSDKIEKQLDNEWGAGRKGKKEMENMRSLRVGSNVTFMGKKFVFIGESGGNVELVPFGAHIGDYVQVNWHDFINHGRLIEQTGKGWHGDSIGHSLAALKAQAGSACNIPMRTKVSNKTEDIWLSIRSNEMMRDTMKALIQEIKSHNIQYTSYGSANRLYLHLKNCPESFKKELGNWTYYQPITQMKKPPNISDYDVTDW